MKAYIFPLLVLLASCGTSHKIVTSSKKTVDSSSTVTRDTSHVSHETSSSDNLNVQNVHIRVEYPADTALAKAKQESADFTYDTMGETGGPGYKNISSESRIYRALRNAIAASGGNGRQPSVITVDIGSISDSSSHKVKSDSGASHTSDAKNLKKTEVDKSKNVTHTGLSLGLKIGIGIFIFIILLVVAWRLYQKFKP